MSVPIYILFHFYCIVQIVSEHPDKPPTESAHPPVAGQQNGFMELHPLHVPGGHVATGAAVGVGAAVGLMITVKLPPLP